LAALRTLVIAVNLNAELIDAALSQQCGEASDQKRAFHPREGANMDIPIAG
jgi:hypothetical protein